MSLLKHECYSRVCISVLDLFEAEDSRKAIMDNDSDRLGEILYSIGFQKKFLKYKTGLHRPLFSNSLSVCGYFESYERTDEEWMRGGLCSVEHLVDKYYNEDLGLYQELQKLHHRPVFTTLFTLAEPEDFVKREGI